MLASCCEMLCAACCATTRVARLFGFVGAPPVDVTDAAGEEAGCEDGVGGCDLGGDGDWCALWSLDAGVLRARSAAMRSLAAAIMAAASAFCCCALPGDRNALAVDGVTTLLLLLAADATAAAAPTAAATTPAAS